ncbi:hypothetical protein Bca101_046468 [Brassica carinata]
MLLDLRPASLIRDPFPRLLDQQSPDQIPRRRAHARHLREPQRLSITLCSVARVPLPLERRRSVEQLVDEDPEVRIKNLAEKGGTCPVFLFFSVNASGQFCGVAEMTGRVDYEKSMDFWQLDKWTGYFPVKWHIFKDVPNVQLRHVILENNENKPVTNSRDTQEVINSLLLVNDDHCHKKQLILI